MTYEDRYRGTCLVSVTRGDFTGRIYILYKKGSPFYRLVTGEKYAEFDTFEEALETLAVL